MKKFIAITSLLALGACAEGFWSAGSNGKSEFAWVGCHEVVKTPSETGEVAFGPFGTKTPRIYFKQVSKDGSVGAVTTAKPCED